MTAALAGARRGPWPPQASPGVTAVSRRFHSSFLAGSWIVKGRARKHGWFSTCTSGGVGGFIETGGQVPPGLMRGSCDVAVPLASVPCLGALAVGAYEIRGRSNVEWTGRSWSLPLMQLAESA